MYEEQLALEKKFSKEQARKSVLNYFMSQENEEFKLIVDCFNEFLNKVHDYEPITICNMGVREYWHEKGISTEEVVAHVLTTIAISGQASLQAVMASACSITGLAEVDFKGGLRLCGQLLSIMEATTLVDVSEPTKIKELRMVTLGHLLPEYVSKVIGNCAYMPPTLIPVRPKGNRDAGWLTTKKSIFLNKNHHNGNAPLHWLETLNSIAFSIDKNMMNYDEEITIDHGAPITLQRKQLDQYHSRRNVTIRTIKEVLAHGNKFHFIHRFCARYRAYAAGYALSPQGNDYRKSLLNLHKQETLTDDYSF